ncbi:MAG: hypothetical protein IPI41_03125 [Flavobacteriales bacterium]|nr:hypothetical protein [Flavobacteriales bacterium]
MNDGELADRIVRQQQLVMVVQRFEQEGEQRMQVVASPDQQFLVRLVLGIGAGDAPFQQVVHVLGHHRQLFRDVACLASSSSSGKV